MEPALRHASNLENLARIERERKDLADYCARRWPDFQPNRGLDNQELLDLPESERVPAVVSCARWQLEVEMPALLLQQQYGLVRDELNKIRGAFWGAGLIARVCLTSTLTRKVA